MSVFKTKFIFFIFLFILNNAFASYQYFDTTVYTVEELKEDFIVWRNKLEKKAPLLYLYNSKLSTNHHLDSLYELINQSMTSIEFYRFLAPSNSFFKDQHTSIFPGTEMFNSVSEFDHLIPVDIKVFGNKSTITFNYSSCNELEIGTEILSINHVSCTEIINVLHSIVPRDGNNLEEPKETINHHFWFYYHLMYGVSASYVFQFISKNGATQECVASGMTMDEMMALTPDEKKKKRKPGIYLEVLDTLKTGILTINDFSSSTFKLNQGKSYERLVEEHFNKINELGLEKLIIDVRNNQGGNPNNVKHTLKYLLDALFQLITELRRVCKPLEESFRSRTKERWYPTLGIGTFKPHKKNFKGKLMVLINGESLSATAELISVLKRYNRATIIGTMLGGNPVILSGSLTKGYWELPNTKLKAFVPNKCQILGNIEMNTGLGVKPDFIVEPQIDDVITNSDRVLLYAIDLINNL